MSKALKLAVALGMTLVLAAVALAGSSTFVVRTNLTGYQEVPAISTTANGTFRAEITRATRSSTGSGTRTSRVSRSPRRTSTSARRA